MAVVRACLGCEQPDDHPKHVLALVDGSEVAWHMDCHATSGCPVCAEAIREKGDARGDEFRVILEGGA